MKRPLAILLLTLSTLTIVGNENKEKLSLETCIRIAMESNYDIKLSRNDRQMADNNVTIQPFLPTISGNIKQNQDLYDSFEAHAPQPDVNKNYTNNNLNADVSLNWRLFDGLSMFSTYETKKQLLQAGELNLRASMEQLVSNIASQYYYIVTQEHRVRTVRLYLEISTMRFNQTQEKYSIGAVSGLEMKQAKIDLNADSSKLVLQKQVLQNAYIQLFEMMNVDLNADISLSDSIVTNNRLLLDQLTQRAKNNNVAILLARNGEKLSDLDLRIARSSLMPTLDFNAAYKFNRTDNSAAAALYSRYNGPTWGFTLAVPLFSGLDTYRKIKNARLQQENSRLSYQQTELQITSNITQLYNIYQKNIMMISFEQESSDAALLNLEAALERYRIGTLSGTEFREIQRSYLEATERKFDAIYQAKVSEINLRYLSGELLIDNG